MKNEKFIKKSETMGYHVFENNGMGICWCFMINKRPIFSGKAVRRSCATFENYADALDHAMTGKPCASYESFLDNTFEGYSEIDEEIAFMMEDSRD